MKELYYVYSTESSDKVPGVIGPIVVLAFVQQPNRAAGHDNY